MNTKTLPEMNAWATAEFGHAALGDDRRTQRLVQMAASVAARPAGKVTQVFTETAPREGAFRFLENDQVDVGALAAAAHQAAARRCRGYPYVYVAVDQTDLRITDTQKTKGLGAVGTSKDKAKGLQVLNALAVEPDGIPLGLVGQRYWPRRVGKKQPAQARRKKTPQQKETGLWMQMLTDSAKVLQQDACGCLPWYQLDRGGDAWPLLLLGTELPGWFTVRSAWDRKLWRQPNQPKQYLWGCVGAQEPMGSYSLHIPAAPGRPARDTVLQVRAAKVELDLRDHLHNVHHRTPVWAVLAREEQEPPAGHPRVEWLLLTTYPVLTAQAAQLVLFAYTQRWRVEDFHKLWKSGACEVESTQLRDRDSIIRWAVLLSSVAVRIQRLIKLSRHQPELPATVEFKQSEIDAAMVATHQIKYRPGQVPSLGEVTLWIAQLGGYTGKSSGGPPGALVLARGLKRLELLAAYFATLQRQQREM